MTGWTASTTSVLWAGSRWLRLCLLVSLWHAPFPWVDCHGGIRARGECLDAFSARDAAFARHLSHFHGKCCRGDSEACHWHVHVTFPGSDRPGQPDKRIPEAGDHLPDCGIAEHSGGNVFLEVSAGHAAYDYPLSGDWVEPGPTSISIAGQLGSGNFFQTYLAESYCCHALIGVARL